MKQLIIWFIPAIITITSSNQAIADQSTLPQIPEKEVVTEHPLKMGTANDKLILRVTEVSDKEKYIRPKLEKIEILNHNKIIYTETETDLLKKYSCGGCVDYFAFVDFKILKGNNQEYLVYSIGIINVGAEYYQRLSFYYTLLNLKHDANKTSINKLTGEISGYYLDLPNPELAHPKPDDSIYYKLVEDKYILFSDYDGYFTIYTTYEVIDNSLRLADKEFAIKQEDSWSTQLKGEQMKTASSIIMYTAPDLHSTSSSIKLTENTQVKFIGIRYVKNDNTKTLVHVIIDGKEGWVSEDDLTPKFGIYQDWGDD